MSKRKAGRRAFTPPPPQRVRCLKDGGYCSERDWEGRCLDPKRGCEWNEVEVIVAKARGERARRALDEVNARLRGAAEGSSTGEEEGGG